MTLINGNMIAIRKSVVNPVGKLLGISNQEKRKFHVIQLFFISTLQSFLSF